MTTKIEIDGIVINISEKQPDGSYEAWFGNNPLVGWGMTHVSAASDLLDKECDYRIDRVTRALEAQGKVATVTITNGQGG